MALGNPAIDERLDRGQHIRADTLGLAGVDDVRDPRVGAGPRPAPPWGEPCARLGLRVDLRTTLPDVVELEALPDHRLKVHAGAPVQGACRFHKFVYTRGDVDILPAGTSDVWQEEQASTSVLLQLSPSLLRRAADDMGLDPDRAGLEPRHQFRDPQIEHIAWALDAESLGLALAVHLLGRYPAPSTWGADSRSRSCDA